MLNRRVQAFKRLLVEPFDTDCDSGLYTLKFYLMDNTGGGMRSFGTQRTFESSIF